MNDKVKKILADIRLELMISHKVITIGTQFNAYDCIVLEYLFGDIDKTTYEVGTSVFILANELWIPEQEVVSSLYRLSNFGLICCQSEKTEGRKLNYQIKINPTVHGIVTIVGFTKNYKSVLSHLCKMGIQRLKKYESPIQGFRIDTLFGDKELEAEPYNAEKEIVKITQEKSEDKARKEVDNQLWRALANEFIMGCSTVWVMAQSAQGFGSAQPNWAMEDCPTKVRAERNELIKTFKQYGGRVTALAWMLFCGGITEVDENGKVKYSINCPHRQFVTSDKKPSQFTRNFNSILKDKILHEWANNEWKVYYILLKDIFSTSIDAPPKQGDEYILSGVKFQSIY
jgi:hypothetical protein